MKSARSRPAFVLLFKGGYPSTYIAIAGAAKAILSYRAGKRTNSIHRPSLPICARIGCSRNFIGWLELLPGAIEDTFSIDVTFGQNESTTRTRREL